MHNFRKTALSVAALLASLIILFSVYTAPYFNGTSYYYQDSEVRDSLAGELDLLISGSSHGFRAFVPEVIDEELDVNSYNLCCAMQTMKGRYTLLKKELSRNDIKTVILEISYNALTRNRKAEGPEGDLYELGRFSNTFDRVSYFFSAFSPAEYGKVYFDTMDRSKYAWECFFNDKEPKKPLQETTKGYIPLDPVDYTISPADVESLYHTTEIPLEKYDENVEYFKKCLDLCKDYGVRVIMVVTPLADKGIITRDGFDVVHSWYSKYAEEYGYEYYDFNLHKNKVHDFSQETDFFDSAHLSVHGAEDFSKIFCDTIKAVDNGEDVSERFFESYSEATDSILESILQ